MEKFWTILSGSLDRSLHRLTTKANIFISGR